MVKLEKQEGESGPTPIPAALAQHVGESLRVKKEQNGKTFTEAFGEIDNKLIHVSDLSPMIKFNHVKAARDRKCEWIFLKKLNGINRHWTRIGSDLNAICRVNHHLMALGYDPICPEIGTDYEKAKAKGYKETFVHPGFLNTLTKDQKVILLENMSYEPKNAKKGRAFGVPKKRKYETDIPIIPNKKQKTSSAKRQLLALRNEGYEIFQNLSTWMHKVSAALSIDEY